MPCRPGRGRNLVRLGALTRAAGQRDRRNPDGKPAHHHRANYDISNPHYVSLWSGRREPTSLWVDMRWSFDQVARLGVTPDTVAVSLSPLRASSPPSAPPPTTGPPGPGTGPA